MATLAGCAGGSDSTENPRTADGSDAQGTGTATSLVSPVGRAGPGDPKQAAAALAGFGTDILRQVHAETANVVISPYSLYAVLAMARAGAKAATAAQLDSVLRLSGWDAQGAAMSAIDQEVARILDAAEAQQAPVVLRPANESWIQDGFDVHQEYVDQLARQFGVSVVAADFQKHPDQMRTAINQWVSERTNSLIPALFGEDSIDSGTLLVLVNALYLKAPWLQPFDPTADGMFTTGSGTMVPARMMRAPEVRSGAVGSGWRAVTLPYAGSGLQMILLVPDPGLFDAVVADLGPDLLTSAGRTDVTYRLTMPPFAITSRPPVLDAAKALGVLDLFDAAAADLSGIAGSPGGLSVNGLVHEATIRVDENGTEAAAATGAMFATGAPPPSTELIIDRPFLFWIATYSGAPLFLGTVTDPTN